MAIYPWRFQAEVTPNEPDPDVTLFVGPQRQGLDANGDPTAETFIEHTTENPMTVKLSELPALLAQGAIVRSP